VPRSAILSGIAGTDVLSLRTFLEILLENSPEYDSDDIDCNASPCMCYHIDDEGLAKEAPGLTPPDQSPRSRLAYLLVKEDLLRARQVDLEAAKAGLEHQRQDLA
jgi:hypothetical protein